MGAGSRSRFRGRPAKQAVRFITESRHNRNRLSEEQPPPAAMPLTGSRPDVWHRARAATTAAAAEWGWDWRIDNSRFTPASINHQAGTSAGAHRDGGEDSLVEHDCADEEAHCEHAHKHPEQEACSRQEQKAAGRCGISGKLVE